MSYPEPKDKYIDNVLAKVGFNTRNTVRERDLYLPGIRASFDQGLTPDETVTMIHKSMQIGHWPAWPKGSET